MPVVLTHCVAAVGKRLGGGKDNVSKAFAICTAGLQKSGILKKGSTELTAKGQEVERRHKEEPDKAHKDAEYEKIIQRKGPKKEESRLHSLIKKLQEIADID